MSWGGHPCRAAAARCHRGGDGRCIQGAGGAGVLVIHDGRVCPDGRVVDGKGKGLADGEGKYQGCGADSLVSDHRRSPVSEASRRIRGAAVDQLSDRSTRSGRQRITIEGRGVGRVEMKAGGREEKGVGVGKTGTGKYMGGCKKRKKKIFSILLTLYLITIFSIVQINHGWRFRFSAG